MKLHFIESKYPTRYICGRECFNNPVNLYWCKTIVKTRHSFSYYDPDHPVIKFDGTDEIWIYISEDQRELDYQHILEKIRLASNP